VVHGSGRSALFRVSSFPFRRFWHHPAAASAGVPLSNG
jgi:hypothetical protein